MPILTKKNKCDRNDSKFVGVYISTEMFSFLSLYCMANSVTKTSIIAELLDGWNQQRLRDTTQEELIRKIALQALLAWKNRPLKKRNFLMFSNALRVELRNKGIEAKFIEKIMNIIRDEKDKDN